MFKKLIIGLGFFLFGVFLSFYFENFFRNRVIELYQWSTSGNLKFVGKNFYFGFGSTFYFLCFGISFLVFGKDCITKSGNQILKNALLWVLLFSLVTILVCSIDANLKVLNCTLCDDGILKLSYSSFNSTFVLGVSIAISTFPNLINIVRDEVKKAKISK